jgi:tRNA U34 5-carboxymethylaminomethyl modifying GTPase MnmE/TrmE
VFISAKNKNINSLKTKIQSYFAKKTITDELILQTNTELLLLKNIVIDLKKISASVKKSLPIDLMLDDLHLVSKNFNTLIGNPNDVDFIESLFSKFCLGK